MDEVLGRIAASGRGTQLAKMDIASAHRMVPVHPDNRPLLAVQWAGQVFFDTRLPFGLRSAPKIFTAVATTWMTISQWARRGPTPVPQIWRYLRQARSPNCPRKMRGSNLFSGIPGVRTRYRGNGGQIATTEATSDTRPSRRLAA